VESQRISPWAEAAVESARGEDASIMTNLAVPGLVPGRAMDCCQRPERSGAREARQASMRDSAEGGEGGRVGEEARVSRLMGKFLGEKIRAIQQIKMKYEFCF
jgi:hypothetical protein